jgi:hypothetical protein
MQGMWTQRFPGHSRCHSWTGHGHNVRRRRRRHMRAVRRLAGRCDEVGFFPCCSGHLCPGGVQRVRAVDGNRRQRGPSPPAQTGCDTRTRPRPATQPPAALAPGCTAPRRHTCEGRCSLSDSLSVARGVSSNDPGTDAPAERVRQQGVGEVRHRLWAAVALQADGAQQEVARGAARDLRCGQSGTLCRTAVGVACQTHLPVGGGFKRQLSVLQLQELDASNSEKVPTRRRARPCSAVSAHEHWWHATLRQRTLEDAVHPVVLLGAKVAGGQQQHVRLHARQPGTRLRGYPVKGEAEEGRVAPLRGRTRAVARPGRWRCGA